MFGVSSSSSPLSFFTDHIEQSLFEEAIFKGVNVKFPLKLVLSNGSMMEFNDCLKRGLIGW